jgi:hypothetical protein
MNMTIYVHTYFGNHNFRLVSLILHVTIILLTAFINQQCNVILDVLN